MSQLVKDLSSHLFSLFSLIRFWGIPLLLGLSVSQHFIFPLVKSSNKCGEEMKLCTIYVCELLFFWSDV
jgi:hypothetical protein